MHTIDETFRKKKEAVAARRRAIRVRRVVGGIAVLVVAAVATSFWWTRDRWRIEGLDNDMVEVETGGDQPSDLPVYVPPVIDLAGDPMTISIGRDGSNVARVKEVPKPDDLVEPGVSLQVEVLSDIMLSSSEKLMTTIPSSPEDFAFFQAQRSMQQPATPALAPAADASSDGDAGGEALVDAVDESAAANQAAFSDPAAGWGETISNGDENLPAFKKAKVEDNTMVAIVTPESQRGEASEDFVDKVLGPRGIDSLALEHHFSDADAKAAAQTVKRLFAKEQVDVGYVVAMRGLKTGRPAQPLQLVQLSIYANSQYIGTMARADDGSFVSGVDPWVHEDLLHYAGFEQQTGPPRQYRLLDAIYSTAARNSVPTGVIGEAILFLSKGEDLNAFATQGDRLILMYSAAGRGANGTSGRVLYASIRGPQKNIECFVFKPVGSNDFACVTEKDQVYSLTVNNGMVTPVNGVLTSTFGPRKHPILGEVRIHKGVDWAAPVGTPIAAAFDGEIAYAGDGKGYGNVVRIAHANNRETRYAHMSRFADGLKAGQKVKAGDIIGYIGTTGLSTGPHLHFELYSNGEAIDPLATAPVVAVASAVASGDTGDAAVELLVDRIVRVESGGSATAKNPLSTATGLGQFIESTWLRMMRTYRPDLARSLGRDEQLKLRFDPTLSREMVRRLAQEGEAYLRARGHEITAGRLYLCHFLGMDGAATVLSAGDGDDLAAVLGGGVISANPFLTGKTVSYVKLWAEAKMRGKGISAAQTAPPPEVAKIEKTSPEFLAYKAAIGKMVAAILGPDPAPSDPG